MSIRRFWLISVANRSIVYTKSFPIVEVKAKQLGLPFLPTFRGPKDEGVFIGSLFSVLGIDTLFHDELQGTSSFSGDEPYLDDSDFNRHYITDINCSLMNQLPVVEMSVKDTKMWPVVVIEQNGILFCALPLVDASSKELIDHISVSVAFAAIQAIIKHFTRENRLTGLEEYISGIMPFGTFVGESLGCVVDTSLEPASRKAEDSVVTIKVNEVISRGSKAKEHVYGTVTIENNHSSSEKGLLILKLKALAELNVVVSPQCTKVDADRIQVNLSDRKILKYLHYKSDFASNESETSPFISYNYKITRSQQQKNVHKLELTINLRNPLNLKFSFFNVQFKPIFVDGSAKVNNSSVNWGQLHLEKGAGLFWLIGSKFPKSGQVVFSCDVLAADDIDFSEALCNFRAENFSLGLRLLKENIAVNANVVPSPKLFTEHTLSSFDYKLQATFE